MERRADSTREENPIHVKFAQGDANAKIKNKKLLAIEIFGDLWHSRVRHYPKNFL